MKQQQAHHRLASARLAGSLPASQELDWQSEEEDEVEMQDAPCLPVIRRTTASAQELAERRRAAQALSTPGGLAPRPPYSAADSGRGLMPRSATRWRPLSREYDIPLVDDTVLHVTEQELLTLPQEYQDAAQLVPAVPQIAPPRKRRQPHPKLSTQEDRVIYAGPARAAVPPQTDDAPQRRERRLRFHWLFFVGLALCIMLMGWILLTTLANWWTIQIDDWRYGRPRTYQVDANLGHGSRTDPNSHFIAENLRGRILVIEVPGDDPSQMKVYTVNYIFSGQDMSLFPVTLSFRDESGDGKLDLIVNVQQSHFVFLNENVKGVWQFVPAPTQEQP